MGTHSVYAILFVFWLFSYQFKHVWEGFEEPDITLVLFMVLLCVILPWDVWRHRYHPERRSFSVTLGMLFFGTFAAVGGGLSFVMPPSLNGLHKLIAFQIYGVFGFLSACWVMGTQKERIQSFIMAVFLFSLLTGMVTLVSYTIFGASAFILGNNYLVLGQTLGCGSIILWAHVLTTPVSHWKRGVWIALCLFFLGILLYSGGRGPLLATGVVLCLLSLLHQDVRRSVPWTSFYVVGGCMACVWLILWGVGWVQTPRFIERIQNVDPEDLKSLTDRWAYWVSATEVFWQHPWTGMGWGQWEVAFAQSHEMLYTHPHNIFLEIASELGVAGLIPFVLGSGWVACRAWSMRRCVNGVSYSLIGLWVFAGLNALKSGDLNDNLLFFVMSGFLSAPIYPISAETEKVRPS